MRSAVLGWHRSTPLDVSSVGPGILARPADGHSPLLTVRECQCLWEPLPTITYIPTKVCYKVTVTTVLEKRRVEHALLPRCRGHCAERGTTLTAADCAE